MIIKVYMANMPHHKNYDALINYDKIKIVSNISDCDVIYSPSYSDIILSTKKPVICGPHFNVFPDKKVELITNKKNIIYIQPSEWTKKFWKEFEICNGLTIKSIPFGVDTNRFKPNYEDETSCKKNVFLYIKSRCPNHIYFMINFLNKKNINYKIFNYRSRYNEQEYLNYLKTCKYGVWVDAHESQGFALQEALSCNVPLLVWNIRYMSQECSSNYGDVEATSIPYWDERCGEFFYDWRELKSTYDRFINNLHNYKPREYILENLSRDKCQELFVNEIKKLMDMININSFS